MKKLFICLSLLIFHFSFIQAQDTLVLKNGQKMNVTIISVTDEIVYSIPPGNNLISIKSSKVNCIKYKDGATYTVIPQAGFEKTTSGNFERVDTLQKKYSITTDFAQYLLASPNIGFEYRISRLVCMGLNFSLVWPSPIFSVNPLADGQFTDPGTVYNGYAVRLYIKILPL